MWSRFILRLLPHSELGRDRVLQKILVPAFPYKTQASVVQKRAITLPQGNGKFDYQLGGAYDPPSGTVTVVRDREEKPYKPGTVYNICYINAFQTQPDKADTDWWKANHDNLLLRRSNGQYFIDPDWPKEIILDTSTAAKRTEIANILNGWIDGCATAGFNAIEPDNLDTYTRSAGLLTRANNLALAKLIADHAHSKNLAIAQKNVAELGSEGKTAAGFDFAVAEECQKEKECQLYTKAYGDLVLEIEYTDNDNADAIFKAACSDHGAQIAVIHRDRDLVPSGNSEYHYEHC